MRRAPAWAMKMPKAWPMLASALNPQLGWEAQWKRAAVPEPDRICGLMLGLCMADSRFVSRDFARCLSLVNQHLPGVKPGEGEWHFGVTWWPAGCRRTDSRIEFKHGAGWHNAVGQRCRALMRGHYVWRDMRAYATGAESRQAALAILRCGCGLTGRGIATAGKVR